MGRGTGGPGDAAGLRQGYLFDFLQLDLVQHLFLEEGHPKSPPGGVGLRLLELVPHYAPPGRLGQGHPHTRYELVNEAERV